VESLKTIMCVEFVINKTFSSEEAQIIEDWALKNCLGIGISSEYGLIEIYTYEGFCFCTPKIGFKKALQDFLGEVTEEEYFFVYDIASNSVSVMLEKLSENVEGKLSFEELVEKMNWGN